MNSSTNNSQSNNKKELHDPIPLIELPGTDNANISSVARSVVQALRSSGFLLIKSPELGLLLQEEAIVAASKLLLVRKSDKVIQHPIDPKLYIMLGSLEELALACQESEVDDDRSPSQHRSMFQVLSEYWRALEKVKEQLLTCIALGLGLDANYLVKLHNENNSILRLLHYPEVTSKEEESDQPENADPIIRCKAHSDYGSITLLLTRVPGLQALIQDVWTPVPYVEGALVVNIGSLLQDWTNGELLATLHRVVDSCPDPRTSLAFFADPNPNVSATLQDSKGMESSSPTTRTTTKYMSVADYIQFRSGGIDSLRSGVAFSEEEKERADRAKN